jgi:hypothetical protein
MKDALRGVQILEPLESLPEAPALPIWKRLTERFVFVTSRTLQPAFARRPV